MAPGSSLKGSRRGARVQVPFTLSDTCTCPGAPYSETQPTSRSPSATGRVSVTVAVETLDPVENAAPWTKVGVVDWAAAVRGSGRRAPRVAITARPAVDRTDGKSFTAVTPPLHALSSARPATAGVAGEEPGTRAHAVLQAISAPAGVSPPSRAAPHALGNVGRPAAGARTAIRIGRTVTPWRTRSCVWTTPEKCGAIRTLDIYWLAGGHVLDRLAPVLREAEQRHEGRHRTPSLFVMPFSRRPAAAAARRDRPSSPA